MDYGDVTPPWKSWNHFFQSLADRHDTFNTRAVSQRSMAHHQHRDFLLRFDEALDPGVVRGPKKQGLPAAGRLHGGADG